MKTREESEAEFRRVAEHMKALDKDLADDEVAPTWREAREIDPVVWFDHVGNCYDVIATLSQREPEAIPEIVQGAIGAAIQWGFEMAVLRYGTETP